MGVVRVKPGVEFATIAPGGFCILSAIEQTAKKVLLSDAGEPISQDLEITSGTDGEHSGPNDPHKRGEAYDVRSHDLGALKEKVIANITGILGWDHFYAFIEAPGTPNEHFHIQVKKGTVYP